MCCGCDELGEGEDCMKVIAAGSVVTGPCQENRCLLTFIVTAFLLVNYGLVLADLVYGGRSIIDTETQITECTSLYEANMTGCLKADGYHNATPYFPDEPGSSNMMLWKFSYGLLVVYALAEAIMPFHIIFGFKKCSMNLRSDNEANNEHILRQFLIGLSDIVENILVSAMSHGQLRFARSSPINRYIFVNGVSAVETAGLVVAMSAVAHLFNNIKVVNHLVRVKDFSEETSQKKWRMKFTLYTVEFLSSGLAFTFAIHVCVLAQDFEIDLIYQITVLTWMIGPVVCAVFVCIVKCKQKCCCCYLMPSETNQAEPRIHEPATEQVVLLNVFP